MQIVDALKQKVNKNIEKAMSFCHKDNEKCANHRWQFSQVVDRKLQSEYVCRTLTNHSWLR